MRKPPSASAGQYATAVLLDDDPCALWPECGCNGPCPADEPFEARPKFHLVEKLLLASIVAGALVGAWCALT